MATLGTLSEQIIRLAAGGDPAPSEPLDIREVRLLVCQSASRQLKVEHFEVNERAMEHLPPHMLIATYQVPTFAEGFSDGPVVICQNLYKPDRSPNGDLTVWADATGAYWSTPDAQAWAFSYSANSGSLIVSTVNPDVPTEELGAGIYHVRITGNGLSIPSQSGVTPSEMIVDCATRQGSISFKITSGAPHTFSSAAISNIVSSNGELSFIYDTNTALALLDSDPGMDIYRAETASDIAKIGISLLANEAVGFTAAWGNYNVLNLTCCSKTVDPSRRAIIKLPVTPITLPRNIGVWAVIDQSGDYYIPIQSGQYYIFSGVHSSGLGEYFKELKHFEWRDSRTLILNTTFAEADKEMTVQLLVIDPSQWSDTDIVPLSADQELAVIAEVLQLLGARPPKDLAQDNTSVR